MPLKFRNIIFLLLLISVVASIGYWLHLTPRAGFKYFYVHCSIYEKPKHLIFSLPDYYICAFKSDGSVVASNPSSDRMSYFDANDKMLWTSNENVHHQLKFSRDEKSLLVISSEIIKFRNVMARSDCFSIRSLDNQIKNQWCLFDHLQELTSLGFAFTRMHGIPDNSRSKIVYVDKEISHANSFSEIIKNKRSGSDTAFAEGNYLVHIFGPSCAAIILDKELKKILWHKNLCEIKKNGDVISSAVHDLQVTAEGNILMYLNFIQPTAPLPLAGDFGTYGFDLKEVLDEKLNLFSLNTGREMWFSSLVEIDPYLGGIVWSYSDSPNERFKSRIMGSVEKLDSGNLLYSTLNDGGRAFEITPEGEKVWTFSFQGKKADGNAGYIMGIKPLYKESFLKVRGLDSDYLDELKNFFFISP